MDAQPLGTFDPPAARAAALLLGAASVALAAALLELSRTLYDTSRGRWYAGNGRDLFHVGAVACLFEGLHLNGLPPAMAFVAAATVALVPLLGIDDLPARRGPRFLLLVALLALGAAPALLEPRSIVDALNAAARALF